MTSSKKRSVGKSVASDASVSHDSEVDLALPKPALPWLTAPRRGLFYVSSILFLGWLCFLGVIAYLVNFQ